MAGLSLGFLGMSFSFRCHVVMGTLTNQKVAPRGQHLEDSRGHWKCLPGDRDLGGGALPSVTVRCSRGEGELVTCIEGDVRIAGPGGRFPSREGGWLGPRASTL